MTASSGSGELADDSAGGEPTMHELPAPQPPHDSASDGLGQATERDVVPVDGRSAPRRRRRGRETDEGRLVFYL